MVHCPKCGFEVEDDDLFCPECGGKILREEDVETENKEPPKKKETKDEKEKKTENENKVRPAQASGGPSFRGVIVAVVLLVIVILLFKSCGTSTAPIVDDDYAYEPEPPETPEEQEPVPPSPPPVDPEVECKGVDVKIKDACWSCGIVSCGLLAEVENIGSIPIYRFEVKAYSDPKLFDESSAWDPVDTGSSVTTAPFTSDYDTRYLEYTPVILIEGDEEVLCSGQTATYGNKYGDGFSEC